MMRMIPMLKIGAVVGAAVASIAWQSAAQASSIDTLVAVAGGYNVYTYGNMGGSAANQHYSSDSQGAMAVGGNLNLMGFGAYSNVVVGGNLNLQNGQINGSAKVGG